MAASIANRRQPQNCDSLWSAATRPDEVGVTSPLWETEQPHRLPKEHEKQKAVALWRQPLRFDMYDAPGNGKSCRSFRPSLGDPFGRHRLGPGFRKIGDTHE